MTRDLFFRNIILKLVYDMLSLKLSEQCTYESFNSLCKWAFQTSHELVQVYNTNKSYKLSKLVDINLY